MKKRRTDQSAFVKVSVAIGLLVCFGGVLLALFARANPQALIHECARSVSEQAHRASRLPVASTAGVYEAWVAGCNGPGNNIHEAHAISVDGSGNVYVTGRSYGNGIGFDYATVKYNSAGQQQWVARYNGPATENFTDDAQAIAIDGS